MDGDVVRSFGVILFALREVQFSLWILLLAFLTMFITCTHPQTNFNPGVDNNVLLAGFSILRFVGEWFSPKN